MGDHLVPSADRFYGFSEDNEPKLIPATDHDEIGRSPFERDVDRIKYTREFRRLKDVTQVARAGESYLYHDRLSHSLKVAQVGRRFTEYILRQEAIVNTDGNGEGDTQKLKDSIQLAEGQGHEDIDEQLKRQLNPAVIEAACLAHDLGHPPFGHLAEEVLDELLQEKTNSWLNACEVEKLPKEFQKEDGEGKSPSINDIDEFSTIQDHDLQGIRFEGNAQTFRILTRLASHRDAETGLGLTLATLNAIQKYPYGRGEWIPNEATEWEENLDTIESRSRGKFGYYKTESEAFAAIRDIVGDDFIGERTITAKIMDYADDLTYAIHDLTDFYRDGRLPLDRLFREAYDGEQYENVKRRELDRLENDLGYDESDEWTPTDVINSLLGTMFSTTEEMLLEPFEGTTQQKEDLEAFTSFLVEEYLNRVYYPNRTAEELETNKDISRYIVLEEQNGDYDLLISDTLKDHVQILQDITKHYVIRNATLMGQQRGQRQVVRELFEALYDEARKEDLTLSAIPKPHQDWLIGNGPNLGEFNSEQERRARIVADFIASLTEPQVIEFHKRLTGDAPGSLQNEIIR